MTVTRYLGKCFKKSNKLQFVGRKRKTYKLKFVGLETLYFAIIFSIRSNLS